MATVENEKASRFPDAELKARAAWHYYVEGLTQERISEVLGIGRIKVRRILSAARGGGVGRFRVRDSVGDCVVLEQKLKARYGLRDAIVVPSAADLGNAPQLIGHAGASHLPDKVSAGAV